MSSHRPCLLQSLKNEDTENISYIIPTPVINHFIDDYKRHGRYTGFPVLGVEWQKMESPVLRQALGMQVGASIGVQVRYMVGVGGVGRWTTLPGVRGVDSFAGRALGSWEEAAMDSASLYRPPGPPNTRRPPNWSPNPTQHLSPPDLPPTAVPFFLLAAQAARRAGAAHRAHLPSQQGSQGR